METNKTFYVIKSIMHANAECNRKVLERVEPCNVKKYMQDLFSRELAKVNKVSDSVSLTKLTPDFMLIKYSELGVNKKISAYVADNFNVILKSDIYSTRHSKTLNVVSADKIEESIIRFVETETENLQTRGINDISVESNKDKRSTSIKYTDEANVSIDVAYTATENK